MHTLSEMKHELDTLNNVPVLTQATTFLPLFITKLLSCASFTHALLAYGLRPKAEYVKKQHNNPLRSFTHKLPLRDILNGLFSGLYIEEPHLDYQSNSDSVHRPSLLSRSTHVKHFWTSVNNQEIVQPSNDP